MTGEKLYELFGDIHETHVKEAGEYRKVKKPVWFKWGAVAACLCFVMAAVCVLPPLSEHPRRDAGADDTAAAPMITIMGNHYTAPNMPVEELPEEYHYLRDLTKTEANHTGLEGCAIYIDPQDEDMSEIYLYQECGTPIDEHTVDPTQRQWAYLQWIVVSETE